MKSGIWYALLIACNLVLCGVLFYKNVQVSECVKQKLEFGDSIQSLNSENLRLLEHTSLSYAYGDFNRIDNIRLKNEKGKILSLSELVSSGYKLIVRFRRTHCLLCVKEFSELLNRHLQNAEQVVYVIDEEVRKNLDFYKTYLNLNGLICVTEKVDERIDNEGRPYVFRIGGDLSVDYLYFPMFGMSIVSNLYIEEVVKEI